MTTERLGAWFLIGQAVAALLWWVGIAASADFRHWFFPSTWDFSLPAFFIADVLVFVVIGGTAAFRLWTRHSWGWAWLCIHTGGAVYASVQAMCVAALLGRDAPGGWLMAVSLLGPAYFAWKLRPLTEAR